MQALAGLEESVGLMQTERGRGGTPASYVRNSGETQPLTLGLHHKQFKPRSRCHRQDPMNTSPSVLGQQVLDPEPTSQVPSLSCSCWVPDAWVSLALLPSPPFLGFTYSTSNPRRARKAPSSMQPIWFLSSCL